MSFIDRKLGFHRTINLFAVLAASLLTLASAHAATGKPPDVTTQSTLASTLKGVTGNLAINKFGDVFEASTFEGVVYEYPASGAARVPVFTLGAAFAGKGLGGVAVDLNQNVYVTTIYVGAQTNTASTPSDSGIYELPFVNGAYPAPYTYSTAPAPTCAAAPTAVCAWGNFLQVTGYYYQGWDFAMDGNGVGYLVTLFDNNSPKNNIYACNAACEARTQGASILVGNLPNAVLSIAADATGDVFYADGSSSVYEVPAGTSAPINIASGFNTTIGVALDQAGNLFVTDSNAVFEIPNLNGVYNTATQVEIVPLPGGSARGYNGGGVGLDIHGNLYAATGYANLLKINVKNGNFAPAATTTGSSQLTFTATFNQPVANATAVVTGAQASDFAVSASTCGTGGSAGNTCSFTGTFSPSGVGLRKASIVVTDSLGSVANIAVAGIGQGSGLTVDPGTVTQVAANFKSASAVAVDEAGNFFIADTLANAVYEYPAGGGARLTLGIALVSPTGVALGPAGNVYVADTGATGATKGRVVKISPATGLQSTIATGLATPKGIFLDGFGTLYVADSTNKTIFALPAAQFGQTGGAFYGTGLTAPSDVVIDPAGNLFVADPTVNQVVRISAEGTMSQVGSGLSNPTGVAVDASGSVLIADQGNQRIVRVPNEAGVLNPNDEVSIQTSIGSPYALRIDPNGNLVVSDSTANVLDAVNRTTADVIFAAVNVGTISASQTVNLTSEGNVDLQLRSPLYTPPSLPFALTQGVPACTPGATLASGYGCLLSATFTPTSKSTQTTTIAFSTSAQNASSPSLTLSGTGLQLATATVTLMQTTPATGSPAYGQAVVLTATIGGSAANGATPMGTASLSVDGSVQPTVKVVNGVATFTVSNLSGGTHTFIANYFGDTNYAAAHSANLSLSVGQATALITLTISADASAPISAASGSTVTFSSTLTPSVPGFLSGTVNFMSGTTVLATGTVQQIGSTGVYTATANPNTIPVGVYSVVAVYHGNANYAMASSNPPIPLTIVASPTFVITPAAASITSSRTTNGSTLLTITSLAGFQGGIDFACSGLPANAVCNFNPAIVTMIAGNGGAPLTVPVQTTLLSIAVDQIPPVTANELSPWSALILLLMYPCLHRMRRKSKMPGGVLAGLMALVVLIGGLSGCGCSNFNTPVGMSTITVTAIGTPGIPSTAPTSATNNATKTFTINLITQ